MRLRTLKPAALAFALTGAMFFVACGGDSDDDDATTAPTETTEPTATATADDGNGNGGDGDGDVLFDGKEVGEFYTLNCSACHGANREGISGLGLPLLPDSLTEDDAFYADVIANGRSGTVMPAWKDNGLSDAEIDALVAFIRTAP
jgi:mono/diheme cytochrome c family protein